MKKELKVLYKKDKKLAIEAAKVLGYKINVKQKQVEGKTAGNKDENIKIIHKNLSKNIVKLSNPLLSIIKTINDKSFKLPADVNKKLFEFKKITQNYIKVMGDLDKYLIKL